MTAVRAASPRALAVLALAAALILGVCAKCPGLGSRSWESTASTTGARP